jgi:hypothetical protein
MINMMSPSASDLEKIEMFRDEVWNFWEGSDDWPVDTKEYVFLGRAISEIGRAIFGSNWTSWEPAERFLPWLDGGGGYSLTDGWGEQYIRLIIAKHDPARQLPDSLTFDDTQLGLYLYIAHVKAERHASADRMKTVVSDMRQALVNGELISFGQHRLSD